MAASSPPLHHTLLLLSLLLLPAGEPVPVAVAAEYETGRYGECYNKPQALLLKLVAIASIFAAGAIGICLPLVSALRPDGGFFVLFKAFASGEILATGYVHVLPDSLDNLGSPCLPETPWGKFPFATFVAMLSAVAALMMDSFATAFHDRRRRGKGGVVVAGQQPSPVEYGHGHGVVQPLS